MQTDSILKAMAALPGVKGLFLSGSYARGTADQWSDLDLVLVIEGADNSEVVAAARAVLEPVVMFRTSGRSETTLINAILPDWMRVDLLLETAARFAKRDRGAVRAVHDPAGLMAGLGAVDETGAAKRVAFATEEFIRVLGLLAVGLGRREYVLCTMGAWLLRDQLMVLMKAEAGTLGEGMLHLSRSVTAVDYAVLARLPMALPNKDSVIQAHLALARAFIPRAKAFHGAHGLDWPLAFEAATKAHLARALELDEAKLW